MSFTASCLNYILMIQTTNSMKLKEPPINVIKASGVAVPFSAEKVRQSLKRAGASTELTEMIMNELYTKVYPNMPTRMIFKIALGLLKKFSRPVAGRYRLKQGIFELGPSGFPFEQFIAALFLHAGFSASTNQIMNGHCVKHEVDVLAVKNKQYHIIECKYHQQPGSRCDVKVPLYIQSRFKDIEWQLMETQGQEVPGCHGWVLTNTRFTKDALQYGLCAGLRLLGWDYPADKGLKDIIDNAGLYPVTCLTTLSRHEKYKLLEKGIVLCKTLAEHPAHLEAAGIPQQKRALVEAEARKLYDRITKLEWA